MNEKIAEAIYNSIVNDRIEHVDVEDVDIYTAIDGACADDMVQLEHGEWDVWGTDDAGEWRIHVYLTEIAA